METSATADRIREALARGLGPADIKLVDESEEHIGHAGARAGGGHYRLRIVSEHFAGKSEIERHRLVYAAVGDLMGADIHALSIEALTPAEQA